MPGAAGCSMELISWVVPLSHHEPGSKSNSEADTCVHGAPNRAENHCLFLLGLLHVKEQAVLTPVERIRSSFLRSLLVGIKIMPGGHQDYDGEEPLGSIPNARTRGS